MWGGDLFAGGSFTDAAGNTVADHIALWNGSTWAPLASSAGGGAALNGDVHVLLGSGRSVLMGGEFTNAGGNAIADYFAIAVRPGTWAALGANANSGGALNDQVSAMTVWNGDLYVGGSFTDAAGIDGADYIARWNSSGWSVVGSPGAFDSDVATMAASPGYLYVGGDFRDAAGVQRADFIARWDGNAWSALPQSGSSDAPIDSGVRALAIWQGDVYAAGAFTDAGGQPKADYIARWNGISWSALGSANGYPVFSYPLGALAAGQNFLYVGGFFTNLNGNDKADYIASWNGNFWQPLGSDGQGHGALNGIVTTIAVSGTDVYAAGDFTNAAGNPAADHLARWNGIAWSPVGDGGNLNNTVDAIALVGVDLYVGGRFTDAAHLPEADRVVRFDGTGWSALGSNGAGDGAIAANVRALAFYQSMLHVGGAFLDVQGMPQADFIAGFDPPALYRPDGRIKKGSSALVGDNIYNTDGTGQTASAAVGVGSTATFTVSIQNDGKTGRFLVQASGASAPTFQVKYFLGTANVTSAVETGTFRTKSLSKGSAIKLTVKVKVLSGAVHGAVTRLMTISSAADPGRIDAVKLSVTRA